MALADWAEARVAFPGKGCWTCQLPAEIREEIDAARREHRVGPDTVIDWLVEEKGYRREECRRGSLCNHFRQRHHER